MSACGPCATTHHPRLCILQATSTPDTPDNSSPRPLPLVLRKSLSVLVGTSLKKSGFGDVKFLRHYVTLHTLGNLSGPQSSYLQNGDTNTPRFVQVTVEEVSMSKFPAQSIMMTSHVYDYYSCLPPGLRPCAFERAVNSLLHSECPLCTRHRVIYILLLGLKFVGALYPRSATFVQRCFPHFSE